MDRKGMTVTTVSLLTLLSFVVAIIIPLPGFVIDLAVVTSLAIAITVYMRANTIKDWRDIKTFPTLLLLSSIFRVALNVTTTRTILLSGQPGSVIPAAGDYIVGGNIWVGIVVFIILIVVQFIIANGAGRTSEVSARFTLDKIPGKQMSIDADLQNGHIDEKEARKRRRELDLEIEFYGNMDGAGKFIKGDVIIGIVLIIVNITVGLVIGVMMNGMAISDAATQYTILTVGDGLVNEVSSLLVTIAAGIVLTRVYDGDENVSQLIFKELTQNPMVLYVVGGVFIAIGIFTKLPFLPFCLIGLILIYIAYRNQQQQILVNEEAEAMKRLKYEEEEKIHKESIEVLTEIEPITVEVGIRLIPLLDEKRQGETLSDKITLMRERLGKRLGVRIPKIHVMDNPSLMANEYQINVKNVPVAKAVIRPDKLLAIKPTGVTRDFEGGIPTKDPIFGSDALWIDEFDANKVKSLGYIVNDCLYVLSLHLTEVIFRNIHELMSRQEVQNLLDNLALRDKVLIDEIKKYDIRLSTIQNVIVNLLKERVSVRDLSTIVESIIDGSRMYENIDDITTIVRERISRQICESNGDKDGKIYAIFLSKEIEDLPKIENHQGYHFNIDMKTESSLILALKEKLDNAQMAGVEAVFISNNSRTRACLVKLLNGYEIQNAVMTTNELTTSVKVKRIGIAELKLEN